MAKSTKATTTRRLRKRARDEDETQLEPAAKQQKIAPEAKEETAPTSVFRFLDLPPELRNQIYNIALRETHRIFPTATFWKEHQRITRSRKPKPTTTPSKTTDPPLPYMALGQTCAQIRAEFHPQWLNQVCVPLCTIEPFIQTFFPSTQRKTTTTTTGRLQLWRGVDRIRIFLRPSELERRNITRLVKLRNRLPDVTFEFSHLEWQESKIQPVDMQQLLNNRHPVWLHWLKTHAVSAVHVALYNPDPIRIVVKDKDAPGWMRNYFSNIPDKYLESLGLEWARSGSIKFGVDYC
ncbi:hypothetical protein DM02DRAFT_25018 [Periconia macrospinosa]|uniref:2EXR domain-containing protein n=1 Tax=Periconia macrospinosa TaxID=97972 RepID=A0A2V1DL90_9PLEO|nr:hypothetical protein DM02DRAFT_25018 [Periconia macrospinosa]